MYISSRLGLLSNFEWQLGYFLCVIVLTLYLFKCTLCLILVILHLCIDIWSLYQHLTSLWCVILDDCFVYIIFVDKTRPGPRWKKQNNLTYRCDEWMTGVCHKIFIWVPPCSIKFKMLSNMASSKWFKSPVCHNPKFHKLHATQLICLS